uniref:Zinc finger protein 292a n=2 Tax=Seriola lalandi dorsalis TaxID=1841481 RepID=A0A3B4WIP1_SERLL
MDALLTSGWRGGAWGYVEHTVCSPIPPTHPLCVRVRVRVWQRNICAYAVVIVVKMAEGETEKEYDTRKAIEELRERFQGLTTALKESSQSPLEASLHFCQEFCQVLVEHAGRWKTDEDPLPLLEVYTVAILSFAKAASCLSSECENVLTCMSTEIKLFCNIFSHFVFVLFFSPVCLLVHEYLELEGPTLLNMRIKHLIKVESVDKAAVLAKMCSEYPGYEGKGNFKQTYLLCICMTKNQEQLMEEIASIDCKDALEMICNLESEGDEKGALCLCSAFLKRQLLQGDVYCAWELTLFWSKLLMRLESSADAFLGQSKEMALLCRSVCHILFLIKVIQNEVGLPVCVEMCIQALKMTSSDHKDSKSTICKTISCLLPTDLEVKRACQLTEFLLQPTVDSYYAVESLYNEPDQKPEEDGSLPVPNSLRCELLLALKTQWPFDPEFWDWKTLKRNCLALMGEEAAIVSSIDTLNDTDEQEVESALGKLPEYRDLEDFLLTTTNELNEITDEREKNREAKKLREQGFVSARFRNWRAYMQYCVLCDKEFLGHRIVRHAQKHFKDGVYLCPICADSFESREVLEPHVASHVKQSCKERLAAMKAARKVTKPPQSPKSPSKNSKVAAKTSMSPVKIESQTRDQLASPVKVEQTTSDPQISQDCFCPVKNCSKAFKFFRNLMAHVRSHKDDEEAMRFLEIQKQKVVCQYCRRQFVNVRHLNDHLQMHCGSKPYICIQLDCKANFNSNSELLMHRKTHPEFKAQCMFPNCGKVFSEAYLLYDHEAQHYLTYTCQTDNCGKIFYSQSQFLSHQENHCTNDMVINLPITNQNPPVTPNVGTPLESTQSKDDTSSTAVCLDRINSDVFMKEASKENTSPCSSPQAANEPAPVRVKHSIESMLNPVADLAMKEPEKCYTPLTNPTTAPADAKPPPEALLAQHNVAGQSEIPPEYPVPSATNPVASQQGEGHNNVQGNEFPKAVPQIISPSQIKTEIPSSLQGYPSSTPAVTAGSEENLHCCPYNDCTRAYSTNKSLSRHVKKQHPEIFEDWKLAKKYNKVAKITAKKAPSGPASLNQSQNLGNRPSNQTGILCNKLGMQQMDYPVGCSTSPAQSYPGSMEPVPITPMVNPTHYPSWGSPNNSSGMMQSDMSQSWSSPPMNNCYPDAFNMNDYPSRSYPQWQADPYQTTASLPSDRDNSMAAIHGPSMSQAPSDSSLMSQYVSSSLMLDNGGQMHNGGHQYGLMHAEGSGDGVDVRKNSASMTVQLDNGNSISTIDSLPEGSYHTPYAQSENSCLTQGSSVDIPMKCLSPEAQVALKATNEIIKTENMSTPGYDQMDNSGDGMLSPHSVVHTDFPYDEDCHNAECEVNPVEEKGGDQDTQKGKRSRLSKRTKWPAIIKDGKVICRRCFREFTSTKSLGGHLSKRSQCRPLDEIDLTADLPTSFLDFLNDPHVPDTNGAIYNMSNGDFSQESCSLTTLTSPMALKQEPQNTNIMEYSSSFTVSPENQQEKAVELANPGLAVPYQEDHLMEISHAFQRLDLIEAAQEKMRSALSLEQNVSRDTAPDIEKSKIPSKSDDKPSEKVPKPFKCDQDDCEYSFMTKEALFKHLIKMHDFSIEMIEELKRTPSKLSPYPCQICPKTFTRTTGLRIHYEKVHRLSKAEMQKLRISARNRRAFRLNKDNVVISNATTDANINRTTRPAAIIPAIKQEPLDIAIAPQTDNENNPEVDQITSPGDAVKEGFTPDVSTVTRLPSPQNYLNDGSLVEVAPVPEGTPEQPNVAVVNQSPDEKQTSNLQEKLSPVSKAKEQRGKSDAALSKVKEPKSSSPTTSASSSPEKPSSSKNTPTKDESQRKEKIQKRLSLKMCDADNAYSPYRPYRCVHEGCTAAFTIQQNLILHYRAMHQASLPTNKTETDPEKTSVKNGQESSPSIGKDNEVRCQVKNCSRVFMGITRLVQHYLLLHKFTRDKATAMMASMTIGTFSCDRPECALPFNSVEKYIEHIKNYHKEIAISESGSVDPTFRCEYEGCDRVYTTKSNLLRHLIKKHEYVYDPKTSDGRRTKSVGLFPGVNGKENVENKFKMKKKNTKKKEGKSIEHWTSFGKPTLKSHEEASAMCTKKSALQYPCMIIGCDAVERAERNIFKHYTTHGLSERYIEDQRSQFIFCKKYSRARFKDANKSEGASSSSSEETEPEEGEKLSDQKTDEVVDRIGQEDGKLSNDDSAESQASTGTEGGSKRGRPRKPAHPTPACPERMQTLRNRSTVNSSRENSNPGTPTAQEQRDDVVMSGSFKPLGLEDSFLKFLETSETTHSSKRKLNDKSSAELPSKRQQTQKQKSAMKSKITDEFRGCENLVDFRNPLNLKSVSNVKIVMDKTFSDGADLLLKQLQDMRPIVIIKKWLYSGS